MVAAAKEYVISRSSMFGSRMSREANRQPTRVPIAAASAQAPLRTRPLRMPTSRAWSGLEATARKASPALVRRTMKASKPSTTSRVSQVPMVV